MAADSAAKVSCKVWRRRGDGRQ